jgi:hypothetical protein
LPAAIQRRPTAGGERALHMNLDGQQIFQLVSLLCVLALFMVNLRGQIRYRRWFKRWEAQRKARRDAEQARDGGTDDRPSSGPWG